MAKALSPASDIEKIRVGTSKKKLNLKQRPIVVNKDGTYSTVDTISNYDKGKEVVVPRVYKENGEWKHGTSDEAWKHYKKTGENLGKYDSVDKAVSAAKSAHYQNDFQMGKIAQEYVKKVSEREALKEKKLDKRKNK